MNSVQSASFALFNQEVTNLLQNSINHKKTWGCTLTLCTSNTTKICSYFINIPCIKCCFNLAWLLCLIMSEGERGRGKMSLPVVNWAYRFLMCQAVALQMRDGTFLRSIFLCFHLEANEVGLPVATWARHSDTKDTLTSQSQCLASLRHPLNTTSTFHSQLDQREICTPAMTHKLECRHACTHTHTCVCRLIAGRLW